MGKKSTAIGRWFFFILCLRENSNRIQNRIEFNLKLFSNTKIHIFIYFLSFHCITCFSNHVHVLFISYEIWRRRRLTLDSWLSRVFIIFLFLSSQTPIAIKMTIAKQKQKIWKTMPQNEFSESMIFALSLYWNRKTNKKKIRTWKYFLSLDGAFIIHYNLIELATIIQHPYSMCSCLPLVWSKTFDWKNIKWG